MSTYSIGQSPTDADKLEDLGSVLSGLPDNTQKLITPKNVRNAIYTTWENITFKLTNIATSAISYIGIDSVDVKNKFLIGKKEKTTGQNVMSPDLLTSDVDVFFFNTKTGTQSSDTKIAILAGTGSHWNGSEISSPYLESSVINNEYVNFNLVNSSYGGMTGSTVYGGDINIQSNYGYVSLNNLVFPKLADHLGSGKEGYVLKYRWNGAQAFAVWEQSSTASIDTIFSTGTVSITGANVVVNGVNVNFTDSNPVLQSIGGIQVGETFNNVPVTTMLRKLIYQYIAPAVTLSLSDGIIEAGDTSYLTSGNLRLNYSISRTSTYSLNNPSLLGQIAASPSIINGASIPIGTTSSQLYANVTNLNPPVWTTQTWTMSVSDGVGASTSSTTLIVTLPWYYGTSTFSATSSNINLILGTSSQLGKLTPLLANPATQSSPSHNKTVTLTTSGLNPQSQGYVYFGYPSSFVDLVDIKDVNGYSIFTSFRKFTIGGLNSPQSRWAGKTYSFYILTGSTSSVVPQLTTIGFTQSPFQFIFATQS